MSFHLGRREVVVPPFVPLGIAITSFGHGPQVCEIKAGSVLGPQVLKTSHGFTSHTGIAPSPRQLAA